MWKLNNVNIRTPPCGWLPTGVSCGEGVSTGAGAVPDAAAVLRLRHVRLLEEMCTQGGGEENPPFVLLFPRLVAGKICHRLPDLIMFQWWQMRYDEMREMEWKMSSCKKKYDSQSTWTSSRCTDERVGLCCFQWLMTLRRETRYCIILPSVRPAVQIEGVDMIRDRSSKKQKHTYTKQNHEVGLSCFLRETSFFFRGRA